MMAGLAPLFWHFTGGSAFIAAALAFAYFSPVFKKTALWVALGGVLFMTAFTLGVQDEKHHWSIQEERVAATADKAAGEAAATVEHLGSDPGRLRNSPDCRDCK